jgi:hypothetical protein
MVYWYCKFAPEETTEIGLRERVAKIMKVSVTTVYNHLAPIQNKLEIKELRFVPEEICHALIPLINELPTEHRTIEEKDSEGRVLGTDVVLVPSFKKLVWPHRFTVEEDPINQLFAAPPTISIKDSEVSSEEPFDPDQRTSDAIEDIVGQTDEEREPETVPNIGDVAPSVDRKPDAIEELLQGTQQDDTDSSQTSQSQATGSGNVAITPPGRAWWTVLVPIAVVLGLILWGVSWLVGRNQPEAQVTSADQELINQLVAASVEAMPPVLETRIVREIVEVTVPPEIIEQTRVVEVLQTVPVLQTVVAPETVVVEVPVTVEVTPVPTPTPTETPLPQTIVISEDFDDGEIDPAFEVIGDPVLVNGQLTVAGDNWLELRVGDESWRNYTIEFDESKDCRGARNETSVRRLNSAERLVYIHHCNGGYWRSDSVNGNFDIPDSDIRAVPRTRIWLEGNKLYQQSEGSTFVYTIPAHENGGIAIGFANGWIDNLVITRND